MNPSSGPENPDNPKDLQSARVLAMRDKNNNRKIEDGEWTVLAEMPGLNHGIAVDGGYLFASTSDKVYRWAYDAGAWEDLGEAEEVVFNIDMTGEPGYGGVGNPLGHTTRTLEFDNSGRMYVSVGSVGNVDGDSFRSRIRRIGGLSEKNLSQPVDFTTAEIFADGLRNEVGLAWADDKKEVLYGVENGMDNLYRADLGGDIHNDNPAEELNAFPIDKPGKFYGYPFCFSEYKLEHEKAEGPGSQWALENQDVADDAFCKDAEKNVPPLYSMQAHSAPLGMAFYGKDWKNISECCGSSMTDAASCQNIMETGLPCEYLGDLFVPFHGSWNRDDPTGHKIVRLQLDRDTNTGEILSVLSEEDFFWAGPDGPKWETGMRPVDIAFGPNGEMFISSRTTGEILSIHRPTGVEED